jgi:hypothetical protein
MDTQKNANHECTNNGMKKTNQYLILYPRMNSSGRIAA